MLAEAARDGAVFVAEAGGVFAGFAAGWLPAFRGRRIAARLLQALEVRLSLYGIKRIRLSALAANKAARTSYERLGYVAYEIVCEKAAPKRSPDAGSADN
jgi:GNAT superfamily N-acetyltransferase